MQWTPLRCRETYAVTFVLPPHDNTENNIVDAPASILQVPGGVPINGAANAAVGSDAGRTTATNGLAMVKNGMQASMT